MKSHSIGKILTPAKIREVSIRIKIGLVCGTLAASSGIYLCWRVLHDLHKELPTVTEVTNIERHPTRNRDQNAIITDNFQPTVVSESYVDSNQLKQMQTILKRKLATHLPSSLLVHLEDPTFLLHRTKSKNVTKRKEAVEILGNIKHWNDDKYSIVANSCDTRTMIGLARTEGVDERFFLPMPNPPALEHRLEDELRVLLSSLPKDGVNKCLEYFTSAALHEGDTSPDRGYWIFSGPGLEFTKKMSRGPDERIEIIYLKALVTHTEVPHSCVEMVKLGVLPLLLQTYNKRKNSIVIRRHIANILANLTVHKELHAEIINMGWITVLSKWIKSADLQLSMYSAKALSNMDSDDDTSVFQSGLYLLHPAYRSEDPLKADIVFVHGLRGNPFRTWRQRDRNMPDKDQAHSDGTESVRQGTYTFCWPKDWLPKDIQSVRILSVEYDTSLSTWNSACPYETEKRTLQQRAMDLDRKLKAADIGCRPIIWVTHSMGGLLVKELLVQSKMNSADHRLVWNTSGIIFFSTPHRGSNLASLVTKKVGTLFSPTVEVQEMTRDCPNLRSLHNNFQQILSENGIRCLSFGESEQDYVGHKRLKIWIVPPFSSDPGFGEFHTLPTTHANVCKPWDHNSDSYILAVKFIKKCIRNGPLNQLIKASMSPY